MDNEYQKEFFDEFKSGDGPLKRFTKNALAKRTPMTLRFQPEQIISLAIIVVLGFVISFALGVEKGKRLKPVVETEEVVLADTVVKETQVAAVRKQVVTAQAPRERLYTIQILSYKDEKLALAKVAELKKKKINASVMRENKLFQVCAGRYADKKEAIGDLRNFLKEYKGCFLRNIKANQ